jgi:hypothetical protein
LYGLDINPLSGLEIINILPLFVTMIHGPQYFIFVLYLVIPNLKNELTLPTIKIIFSVMLVPSL